jgi:hypothetical protein
MTIYLLAQGVSVLRFYMLRSVFPVANRHPLLVLIMTIAYMGFVMVFQIPVIFDLQDIPCTAWVYFMVFFALVAVNVVMLRIFLLYVAFISTQKSINFSERVTRRSSAAPPPAVEDQPEQKALTGWELKIEKFFAKFENSLFMKRQFFNSSKPLQAMCVIILLEMIPMTAYAIRYPELAQVAVVTENCRSRFVNRATTLFVILLSLYIFVLALSAWRMKKLAENFHIVEEFKGIAFGCCLTIVIVIIGRIPAVNSVIYNSYPIGLLLLTGIPAMVFWWVCLERIIQIAVNKPKSKLKNLVTRQTSTKMLTLERGTLKQRSFSGKENPDANLYTLLQDEEGLELFKHFLMKEFCVENLLFWMDCNEIMHLSDDTPDIPLRVMAMYMKYVHPNAPLMVNISSKSRVQIVHRVKMVEATFMKTPHEESKVAAVPMELKVDIAEEPRKSGEVIAPPSADASKAPGNFLQAANTADRPAGPTEDDVAADAPKEVQNDAKRDSVAFDTRPPREGFEAKTVFNDACEEVFHLMSTDPFKRFCHSDEFEAWMKKNPGKLPETLLL